MMSPLFALYNGGKESMTLNETRQGPGDLQGPDAQGRHSDENLVPGTMDEWGLATSSRRSTSGSSTRRSPGSGARRKYRRARPRHGDAGDVGASWPRPAIRTRRRRCRALFVDTLVSPHMVSGILAALYERERTGRGCASEIACATWRCIPFNLYNIYYNTGRVPGRAGNVLVGYSPGNLYETSDGHVYIASNLDKQAHAVFSVIGRDDLSTTEGFRTRAERWQNREEVDRIVGEWTRARAKRDVFEAMIAADVPCGIVLGIAVVLQDDDLNARAASSPTSITPASVRCGCRARRSSSATSPPAWSRARSRAAQLRCTKSCSATMRRGCAACRRGRGHRAHGCRGP
jgi:formyl-CoA transferase